MCVVFGKRHKLGRNAGKRKTHFPMSSQCGGWAGLAPGLVFAAPGLFTRLPRCALLAAAPWLVTLHLHRWFGEVPWLCLVGGTEEPAPGRVCLALARGGLSSRSNGWFGGDTKRPLGSLDGPEWERRPNAAQGQDPALASNRLGGFWREIMGQAKPLLQRTGFNSPGIPASPGFTF